MKRIGCIEINKDIIDGILKYHSVDDYVTEGLDIINKSLTLLHKKDKTKEEELELTKYTARITELNFLIGMLRIFTKNK